MTALAAAWRAWRVNRWAARKERADYRNGADLHGWPLHSFKQQELADAMAETRWEHWE